MAVQHFELNPEHFCCSICLELLEEPVCVPCGHSYCRACIEGHWSPDHRPGGYSCPECREMFDLRPALKKNTMLAVLMESLKECKRALAVPAEPKTRAQFLEHTHPVTLDPNTAHQFLCLSQGTRKVTLTDEMQLHPPHPERFKKGFRVLSREALAGRCYWEVEWSGKGVYIAVSYKEISTTGCLNETGFGFSDQSWSLLCFDEHYAFRHGDSSTWILDMDDVPSRVGVYLDHGAGTLSFYNVSNARIMRLLHRVETTFSQPLYAGFDFSLLTSAGATAEIVRHWN